MSIRVIDTITGSEYRFMEYGLPPSSGMSANQGYFAWTVPQSVTSGSNYKVVIVNSSNTSISDISDLTFTITAPPTSTSPVISVSSPTPGAIYKIGDRVNVNWSVSGSIPTSWPTDNVGHPQVIIDLYTSGGSFVQHLSALHGGGPVFPFDVPNVVAGSYEVRVWAVNNLPYLGQSGTFTITAPVTPVAIPFISVVSPNGGETWEAGKTYTFRWSSQGIEKVTINLDNLDTGSRFGTLDFGLDVHSGQASWTVPTIDFPAGRYKAFMISFDPSASSWPSDSSDSNFTVTTPTVAQCTDFDSTTGFRCGCTSTSGYSLTTGAACGTTSVSPSITVASVTANPGTISSGDSVKLNFTWPSDTTRAVISLGCPFLVSGVGCSTNTVVTSNSDYTFILTNTSGYVQNVLAEYTVYTSSNSYGSKVSTQFMVQSQPLCSGTEPSSNNYTTKGSIFTTNTSVTSWLYTTSGTPASCQYTCTNGGTNNGNGCSAPVTAQCTDSDGGVNIDVAGLTDGRVNGLGSYFNDSSVGSNGGQCSGTDCTAVAEGYCTSDNKVTNYLYQCPSGYSVNGACATKSVSSNVGGLNLSASAISASSTSTTENAIDTSSFHFTQFLEQGSYGNEVMELQKLLNRLGYYNGNFDAIFGPKLKEALINFQIANGLKGDGIAGYEVRTFLNK